MESAGGMHIAEITSDKPVTIVEVELKKPGSSAKAPASPLDPVKLDPKELQSRARERPGACPARQIGPHKTVPLHEHMLNRVVVYITDQNFRVTTPDGRRRLFNTGGRCQLGRTHQTQGRKFERQAV